MSQQLKIVLPSGSLQENTLKLMRDAGLELSVRDRSYVVNTGDPSLDVRLLRAQEVARYVERGKFDAGITGLDWVVESGSTVLEVADLPYAKQSKGGTRWVLAAPQDGGIKRAEDLQGKVVATEVVNLAKSFFEQRGVNARVEFSWGSTESKPPGLADAIIDVTETGSSLRANRLAVLDDVFFSTPRLVANPESLADRGKRDGIEGIAQMLRAVVNARDKLRMELNVEARNLDSVVDILPALQAPDVVSTASGDWRKVTTIIERCQYKLLLPELQRRGAKGVIASEIERLTPDELPAPILRDGMEILAGSRTRNLRAEPLDWEKSGGLIPCIVQDRTSGDVRMLGYMNREALDLTLQTGKVTFYSRTRGELWTKGSSSGNVLTARDVRVDCDYDAILIKADAAGPTCHNGNVSCFDRVD